MNFSEFFSSFFKHFIYEPQLNILQLLYNFTGDIGLSIMILAIVVNLILWPLFASTYINGQKTKILQPQLQEIQTKYKNDPQALLQATRQFYQKHRINNGAILWVLIGQLLVASGLWTLTSDVSRNSIHNQLYAWLFPNTAPSFNNLAFGILNIGDSISSDWSKYLWLPVFNSLLSYLYGKYVFHWAPKLDLSAIQKPTPKQKKTDEPPAFDAEAMQKTLEWQTIYMMPIFFLFINSTLTVGVNLYFIAVSFMSLIRQIVLTQYYKSHIDQLVQNIVASDPSSRDEHHTNNSETTADPAQMVANPQPVLVTNPKQKDKPKKKLKKK
jgi:YidC/Oxa1 family membrane protein insertase